MMKRHLHSKESGFTMVVIATLFIAFAVIAAVSLERNTILQQINNREAAIAQLNRLSNAIIEYAVFNKNGTTLLYPCPAPLTGSSTAAGFGASIGSPPTTPCSGMSFTSSYATTGTPGVILYGTDVLQGMVPVTTLSQYGIGFNDAFDPWNNRIVYVVNRTSTLGSAARTPNTNPTISDRRTNLQTVSPDFILISLGRDGVGSFKRANATTTASIACTTGTTTLRLENCDNDNAFYTAPTNINTNVSGEYFDDILTWYRQ